MPEHLIVAQARAYMQHCCSDAAEIQMCILALSGIHSAWLLEPGARGFTLETPGLRRWPSLPKFKCFYTTNVLL